MRQRWRYFLLGNAPHPPFNHHSSSFRCKLQRAANKSLVNYGFFIGTTAANLPNLTAASPVSGMKIFMGSSHGALLVSREAENEPIFAMGKRLIAVHAEDRAITKYQRLC